MNLSFNLVHKFHNVTIYLFIYFKVCKSFFLLLNTNFQSFSVWNSINVSWFDSHQTRENSIKKTEKDSNRKEKKRQKLTIGFLPLEQYTIFFSQNQEHGNFFCHILQSQWYWQMKCPPRIIHKRVPFSIHLFTLYHSYR